MTHTRTHTICRNHRECGTQNANPSDQNVYDISVQTVWTFFGLLFTQMKTKLTQKNGKEHTKMPNDGTL